MNIFKQFYKSTHSPKDIAMYRYQGIGKTILYVFFLSLISIIPSIVFLSTILSTGIETSKNVIENEIPSFSIENGILTAETDVPVIIDQEDFSIILDPTGNITEEKVGEEGNAFALLTDKFVLSAGGRIDTYPYTMLEGIYISEAEVSEFIDLLDGVKGIIIPVMSFFIFLFSSAANFIEVSVLALFGLFLKSLTGRNLKYRQLWRMAAYSETLPTVFFTIMAAINTTVPNSFFINWFVAIIVLYLAINEIPKPKSKTVNP
ncbi:MAG: hypothetical protein K0Q87_4400 [Neobacillus sp.]|jgi:hypothetical protein|nr:hypothetical protein [Neobacillus sp.]